MVRLFSRRSPDGSLGARAPGEVCREAGRAGPAEVADGLDDEGGEAARRCTARHAPRSGSPRTPRAMRRFDRMVPAVQVEAVLCVALAPPASAAKWLRWERATQAAQVVTPVVVRRGRRVVRRPSSLPPTWCRRGRQLGVEPGRLRGPAGDRRRPRPADAGRRTVRRGLDAGDHPVDRLAAGRAERPRPGGGRTTAARRTEADRPRHPRSPIRRSASTPISPPGSRPLAAEGLLARQTSCTCAWPVSTRPAGRRRRRRSPRPLVALGLRGDELPGGLARLQRLPRRTEAVRRALGDLACRRRHERVRSRARRCCRSGSRGLRADRPARERLRAVRLEPGRAPSPESLYRADGAVPAQHPHPHRRLARLRRARRTAAPQLPAVRPLDLLQPAAGRPGRPVAPTTSTPRPGASATSRQHATRVPRVAYLRDLSPPQPAADRDHRLAITAEV